MPSARVDIPAPGTSARRWKHGSIPVIGLTGAIGGGKSRVATSLALRGAVVIDADRLGHEVLEDPAVRGRLVDRFGSQVAPDGRVDRRALGPIVFADPAALHDLETIVHPEIKRRTVAMIDREEQRGVAAMVVLDAPLLLESGWEDLCDVVIFVDASRPIRLARVAVGRGWSDADLAAREAAQWPVDRKRARADAVLMNEGSLDALDDHVDRLFRSLDGAAPAASDASAARHDFLVVSNCGLDPPR